jgi:hypothetical protein
MTPMLHDGYRGVGIHTYALASRRVSRLGTCGSSTGLHRIGRQLTVSSARRWASESSKGGDSPGWPFQVLGHGQLARAHRDMEGRCLEGLNGLPLHLGSRSSYRSTHNAGDTSQTSNAGRLLALSSCMGFPFECEGVKTAPKLL